MRPQDAVGVFVALRYIRVKEVGKLGQLLVQCRLPPANARFEVGDRVLEAPTFPGMCLTLRCFQLALARILMLVAPTVGFLQLGAECAETALRIDRSVDVCDDAALATALGDLVALLLELPRV